MSRTESSFGRVATTGSVTAAVGYWRFDETNITMSAKDLSGHGRDGTYSAGVTFGVPGGTAGVIAGDTAAHYAIGKGL